MKSTNNRIRIFVAILVAIVHIGCASVDSVSITQIPKERDHVVETKVNTWRFLGIGFSNDFALEAQSELMKKCPEGDITGIITTYESYWYLLLVNKVVKAKGYCSVGSK